MRGRYVLGDDCVADRKKADVLSQCVMITAPEAMACRPGYLVSALKMSTIAENEHCEHYCQF